jgi:hypothetical protein
MPNTLSSSLLVSIVEERAITVLQNRLAPLMAFSNNFSRNGIDVQRAGAGPLATIQVPVATAAATTIVNGTNFEAGNSTVTNKPISVSQYTQAFHITNAHLQSGHKLEYMVDINAHALADKLLDVCMALETVATYGTAAVTSSAANFDSDDLALVWAAIEKARAKNIVLTGAYFAKFLPTNRDAFVPGADAGAYGWQGFYHTSRMVADTNVVGFGCDPAAMGVASALPLVGEGFAQAISTQTVEIPGLAGMAVQFNRWLSVASREEWASFDICFGAGVIDTTALKIILSAAQ